MDGGVTALAATLTDTVAKLSGILGEPPRPPAARDPRPTAHLRPY